MDYATEELRTSSMTGSVLEVMRAGIPPPILLKRSPPHQSHRGNRLDGFPSRSQYEEKSMKRTIWAVSAIGMVWILVTMAPDIRRYLRMVTM